MLPLTRRPSDETIRNVLRWIRRRPTWPVLAVAALCEGGCATPGLNHLYVSTGTGAAIRDVAAESAPAAVPSHLAAGETILGLAYDFNTDHLFLRLSPGNVVRVIERPSGRVLRDQHLVGVAPGAVELAGEPTADLAIRSRDRHLFAVRPDGRSIAETTLFGKPVRTLTPAPLPGPIGGLAWDQRADRLLVLVATAPAQIGAVGPDGNVFHYVTLSAGVRPVTLGYDSDAQHCFVPLADGLAVGVFDTTGRLVSRLPCPEGPAAALDAGPRSFLRVF